MEIRFTGRHQEMTEKAKSYLEAKLERSIKNIPKVNGVHVIFDSERFQHKVEVIIHLNHMQVRAAEKSDDVMASIDNVVDKLQRQLKKYKDKLQDHRATEKELLGKAEVLPAEDDEDEVKKNPRLLRVKKIAPKPMDAKEAMMQLALTDDQFLTFVNAESNGVNVVYKKKDGNYGLIEPRAGVGNI